MDSVNYWEMTYKEIVASIRAYQERQKISLQMDAIIAYRQANQLAHLVGIVLGSKESAKELYQLYPGIFPELEKQAEMQKVSQQNWQIMKARIEAYAAEKRKRGERNGYDT